MTEEISLSPISNDIPTIYLASESPRRHQLLNQIGIRHEILRVPKPEGEDEPQFQDEAPEDYVVRTAQDKSDLAWQYVDNNAVLTRPILTADTCVMLDGAVLGKPNDENHASQMLLKLSGRMHEVHTAVVLNVRGQKSLTVSKTKVYFRKLSMRDVSAYITSGEPFGKAGAYGIQGMAAIFIEKIEGSYTGVVGLPVYETYQLLTNLKFSR
ncbi:Maf family protein [Taylorella equigenitalis]|uniref:dTTP/UTP pyrophosphatase n=2 Tax=Taylorella equigenitalis TaxID=29575 RepID=I7IIC4_9BURK|nr:Maf family protein [Taylorella equigenitalis]AFN35615.1 Maf-like protein [Taylorella equigenitalis ATCC 35865]ASY39039.1 septum formation inhibitor Maf [Taylorella equigenitalis]WDU46861.1 septum formation inhibitor Maf [Taylorella equigenitalis]WDU49852.1 septum formation inhibitor Maf [Taylorella equigenitalis]WDU53831.1 septum formation inhibitor Maf [Taylorella equigenitalis]